MKKKILAAMILVSLFEGSQAMATSFVVNGGQTLTTAQTLGSSESGMVNSGGTLSVTGNPAVTVTGAATLSNNGLISASNDSAIVVAGTSTSALLTNNGHLQGIGNSDAVVSIGGTNATLFNAGTITATGGNLAVDLGSGGNQLDITAGSAQINGNITGGLNSGLIIEVPQGQSFSYGGIISGAMYVTVNSVQTTLNGNNTYSGGTGVCCGATLVLGNSNAAGTGPISIVAGTLTYRNGDNVANPIALYSGSSSLEVDGGDTATQSGAITQVIIGDPAHGGAGFTKLGTGTLILTGNNAFYGTTVIQQGTLIGNTTSIPGYAPTPVAFAAKIVDNASLVFDQSFDATYASVISGTGSFTKTGSGALTLTGANTYSGGTIVDSGTLQGDSNSLQGNIVDNAVLSFQQNTVGSYTGNITGTGNIIVNGSGTLILNGNGAVSGGTTVQSGTLEVGEANTPSASLGGNVNVLAAGTLRGHGTIDGNVVNAGTVWPGGSIGTLTIHGNYTQTSAGKLNIDATPNGQASLLTVSGSASIQGSTIVLAQDGNWAPHTAYTILTAGQGISGQFSSAASSLTFLTPVLSYDSNSVTLSLNRNDIRFGAYAQTPNQLATANAVETLGWNSAVYNAMVLTDPATAPQALDRLSGKIYANTRTALIDDSRYVREAVNNHLLEADNSANGSKATNTDGLTAWMSGWGHWGANGNGYNATRLQANGSGVLIGADMLIRSAARVGMVVGREQDSARIDTLDSSSHTTATHLGVYGGIGLGQFQLLAAASYAWQSVDSHRSITFPGFSGLESSRYNAHTMQAYLDGSYTFAIGRNRLAPYVNVAHVQLQTDAAHENAGSAALNVNASTSSSTYATAGLRGTFALDARGDITLHSEIGWQESWGNRTPESLLQFQSGGSMFGVAGAPLARHAGVADVGLSMAASRSFVADVSYNGQFAGHTKDQAAYLKLTWAF